MKRLVLWCSTLIILISISGLRCQSQKTPSDSGQAFPSAIEFAKKVEFPSNKIQQHIATIAVSAHPIGSARQKEVFQYIKKAAEDSGFQTYTDSFKANVPNPAALDPQAGPSSLTLEKDGQNLIASLEIKRDCTILFASHYDSKFFPDFVYRGANDGASSSAALLWLLSAMRSYPDPEQFRCNVMAVWFDGEEAYLENWTDGEYRHPARQQDNTYGSRHLAAQLQSCAEGAARHCLPEKFGGQKIVALILLDLIGSPNIQLTPDSNSTAELRHKAMALTQALEMPEIYRSRFTRAIEDDHIPFMQLNIPVINLIDFENLQLWHKPGDDPEYVDINSVEKASRLALALALQLNLGS